MAQFMATIKEYLAQAPSHLKRGVYVSLLLVLSSSAAFGLGRASILQHQKMPIHIYEPSAEAASSTDFSQQNSNIAPPVSSSTVAVPSVKKLTEELPRPSPQASLAPGGTIIGVKSSKHYYFPWCGTVKRLKESSVVVFPSIDEAQKAGYSAAKNCKGLQ